MKKIVLVAALVAGMSFVACGSKDKAADAAANDTANVVVEEAVVEEVAVVDTNNQAKPAEAAAEAAEAPAAEAAAPAEAPAADAAK